jgi:signal transduction histidine kinase
VDCVAILRKIGLDLLDQLQSRRVELRLLVHERPCREDDSFMISGDELLTYSMLANLIKNALEASPVGQVIEVAMRKAADGRLEIIIHNEGAVPEELRASFFDKYVTWGKRGGSGLGTYSARLMAVTQGGDITMRSSVAHGTFVVVGFGGSAPGD